MDCRIVAEYIGANALVTIGLIALLTSSREIIRVRLGRGVINCGPLEVIFGMMKTNCSIIV